MKSALPFEKWPDLGEFVQNFATLLSSHFPFCEVYSGPLFKSSSNLGLSELGRNFDANRFGQFYILRPEKSLSVSRKAMERQNGYSTV